MSQPIVTSESGRFARGLPMLHPCARCARAQKTCCQRAEILVTSGDRDRIARHSGRSDFWTRRAPADPAYLEPQADDPEWVGLTFAPDGTRRVLVRLPDGDCTFLGAEGCTLPEDVRPLVCRLYPFTYTATELSGEEPDYCPVALLAPQGEPMSRVLDMRAEDAERWRAQLYTELRSDEA